MVWSTEWIDVAKACLSDELIETLETVTVFESQQHIISTNISMNDLFISSNARSQSTHHQIQIKNIHRDKIHSRLCAL